MIKVGVLTLSDKGASGQRVDESGPLVKDMLVEIGEVVCFELLPDDRSSISTKLRSWCDELKLNLIVTTGGTGLTPRDVTPQATLEVIDYEVPGMAELMRMESLKKTPHAILSRAIVGVRGQSLIINLPGSPKGAKENLAVLMPSIPHALTKLAGDPTDCAG